MPDLPDDHIVQPAVGGDDAGVVQQSVALAKVEVLAEHIRNFTAGFHDNKRTGGMIPDLFFVIRRGWPGLQIQAERK